MLSAIFRYNAGGTEHRSVHSNFLGLVQFARSQEQEQPTHLTGDEKELRYCFSQFESVIQKFETLAKIDNDHYAIYNNEARWGKQLLRELKEEPQDSNIYEFYTLILNNWDELKGWGITYRLLAGSVCLKKDWESNYKIRTELLKEIKLIADEWTD